MSWDCPHWLNEICQLNGVTCKPGKGKCVLKDKYVVISGKKNDKKSEDNKKK